MTITWSDEQMVESLEVTVTSQVTVTWKEVTVIPSSDEQMVEANVFMSSIYWWINNVWDRSAGVISLLSDPLDWVDIKMIS